ncbi:MAG: ATP synthase F1 subunit delta [Candidatus Symbiobacter sp.]|nr:ATP synthase F1 subunit delta [Candidatus Symbiobacter sp.]
MDKIKAGVIPPKMKEGGMEHQDVAIKRENLYSDRAGFGLVGRYVQALVELANEQKLLAQTAQDCDRLSQAIQHVPGLKAFVHNPAWTHQAAAGVMRQVTAPLKLSPLTEKFIGLVVSKGRLAYLPAMLDEFAAACRRQAGELDAEIVTATPLSQSQADQVQKTIEQSLGVKLHLDCAVEPKLIGGMVLRLGTWMIDFSLQNKLNRLQQVLQREGA